MFALYPVPVLGYMCRRHSLAMLMECDMASCVLCKRYALLQCPRLGTQKRPHKCHQACRRWQYWGIFYWYARDVLSEWEVPLTICENESWIGNETV
jgi:hypothetical protein